MKKVFLLLMCMIIVISMIAAFSFSGCKTTTTTTAAAEETTAAAEETTAASEASEKIKIAFWNVETDGIGKEIINAGVARFMAANPNVEVENIPVQDNDYKTKIKVAVGAGSAPDVFMTWTGGVMYDYVKAGQILDITEMMGKDNYKDRFLDAAINQATYDGKIWAVPVENCAVALVFYNKTIFEQLGITSTPETYDEFLADIELIKASGIAPIALANKNKWTASFWYMYLVDRLGGPDAILNAANRLGGSFEDEPFIKAGQMLVDLVNMNAFCEGFNGLDWDAGQSKSLMMTGKAAMELMGNWDLGLYASENPDFYNNELDFFRFPGVEGGIGEPTNLVGTIGDNFYCISSKSAHPEEAFALIQTLFDEQGLKERIADMRIPPVKGFETDDAKVQKIVGFLNEAKTVQLWWDQYLPPEIGEAHLNGLQSLLGLSITPEEFGKMQEDAAKSYFQE